MAAAARALAMNDAPSVQEVIAIAGMGRNTFYEYFDDVAHARSAAEANALRRLEEALREAEGRTRLSMERFRALSRAWFDVTESAPAEQLLALRSARESGLSPAGVALESSLVRALDTIRASGVKVEREPLRLRAVAATAEVFARTLALSALSSPALTAATRAPTHSPPASEANSAAASRAPEAPPAQRSELERVLVDVAVRLLR
jgi:AcrR family transcriptional regulator